jgi:hypothetical protein
MFDRTYFIFIVLNKKLFLKGRSNQCLEVDVVNRWGRKEEIYFLCQRMWFHC